MTEHTPLFFAHANGFPAGSYRRLFETLQSRFRIVAPEKLGHHPDYPVAPNWEGLVDELLDTMARDCPAPAVGVGHSLGGVLIFLAAVRQPRRFRAFVMLDPPIVFGWTGWLVQAAKRLGCIDRITPAGLSIGRRRHWPSPQAAIDHLREKSLFRHFREDCLRDYVGAGTVEEDGGVRLVYDPDIEVEIFRHIPHHLAGEPAPVRVPGGVLVARGSNVVRRPDLERMRRRHGLLVREVDGGHMFPMERPEEAGLAVIRLVEALTEKERASARPAPAAMDRDVRAP